MIVVAIIATTTNPISKVADQPKPASRCEAANLPMIVVLVATIIMPIIKGTATTPLNTALQTSMLIGLSGLMAPMAPIRIAAPINP